MKFAKRRRHMQPSDIRQIGKLTAEPDIISFAGGMPDPQFFPKKKLKEIAGQILGFGFLKGAHFAAQLAQREGILAARAAKVIPFERLDIVLLDAEAFLVEASQIPIGAEKAVLGRI